MGGRGMTSDRNNNMESIRSTERFPIVENKYGFEVGKNSAVEFSDSLWEKMAELRGYFGAFEDDDLRKLVDNRISELVMEYGDLELYDSNLTTLVEKVNNENLTDDEYWAAYHVEADYLGIKQPRYSVLDQNQYAFDDKYSSVEQANQWANEHSDAAYVYDSWTRKYQKIGGKQWKKFY